MNKIRGGSTGWGFGGVHIAASRAELADGEHEAPGAAVEHHGSTIETL